jgi:hypothetical protein
MIQSEMWLKKALEARRMALDESLTPAEHVRQDQRWKSFNYCAREGLPKEALDSVEQCLADPGNYGTYRIRLEAMKEVYEEFLVGEGFKLSDQATRMITGFSPL